MADATRIFPSGGGPSYAQRALLTFTIAMAFGLGLTSSAKADIIATIGPFDEARTSQEVIPSPR